MQAQVNGAMVDDLVNHKTNAVRFRGKIGVYSLVANTDGTTVSVNRAPREYPGVYL